MNRRKPMRASSKPRATSAATIEARAASGHTLAFMTVATGKTAYDLLRLTQDELQLARGKRAAGTGDAGDETWA